MATHTDKCNSSAARLGQTFGRGVRAILDVESGLWNGLARLGLPIFLAKLAKWATRAGLLVAAAGVSLYFLFPFFVFCFAVFGILSVGANKDSAGMAEAFFSQSSSAPNNYPESEGWKDDADDHHWVHVPGRGVYTADHDDYFMK